VSTWAAVRVQTRVTLGAAGVDSPDAEARWLTEHVSGFAAQEWTEIEQSDPTPAQRVRLEQLIARRVAGEPLQYVIASWSFRGLELLVDHRVLVPRPETEWLVELALQEAVRVGLRRGRRSALASTPNAQVADLGTGSGAIAISLAAELPEAVIWASELSHDAIDVATANVAGCGAAGVRIVQGNWFGALPNELRGDLALVVANPPYVAAHEFADLPAEVRDHEPHAALVSGPSGNEAIEQILQDARRWLRSEAALVCELAPQRAAETADLARGLGYAHVVVHPDLADRPRVLVARWP
jgi:release factor glutamine methyltransferase